MSIGGTGVGGTAQPPQIRESETNSFTEVTKKNILAMLPPDSLEVIPFTQRAYDETFKYKAESGKPSLHNLLALRTAAFSQDLPEEAWQPSYQALLDSLPPELREQLEQEGLKQLAQRDPDLTELNGLLVLMAKGFAALQAVLQPPAPNSPDEQDLLQNLALPHVVLRAVIDQADTILNDAKGSLNAAGANNPDYEPISDYVSQLSEDVNELNSQRQILVSGGDPSAVKQTMMDISSDLARLGAAFERTSPGGGDFQIIGQALQALSVVSSAWALEYGSPSLLLAFNLATTGISASDSGIGLIGGALNTALDSITDGLLSAIFQGAGAQLAEMEDLYNSLAQLRDT